jgi:hypothetical protein
MMAKRKYEHLVKPLSVGGTKSILADGPGNAGQKVWLNGRDHLEGLNLNFSWGLHNGPGDWHAGLDPHVHPYPECHVFVGLDTANLNYLGAEIECCLGEEQETYTFNEATVVVIPAGLPHGPTVTKRLYSPKGFGFYLAALNSTPETTWLGEGGLKLSVKQKAIMQKSGAGKSMKIAAGDKILKNSPVKSTGKYAHLVKPLKSGLLTERGKFVASGMTPEQMARFVERNKNSGEKLGPGNADHLAWLYGKDLESLDVNLTWGFYSKPGIWHRGVGAHVHPADEVLVFLGTDPNNIDYLGAEIEIDMGKEHERYLFDKPTVVICPGGLPHNPVVIRWVDRPYAFCVIGLSGSHETKAYD